MNRVFGRSLISLYTIALSALVAVSDVRAMDQAKSYYMAQAINCSKMNSPIEIAVGWPLEKAKMFLSVARPRTPGMDAGLSTYINLPSVIRYRGGVTFDIKCPRMVVISQKNSVISYVQIYIDSKDPYDLNQVFVETQVWRKKLEEMKFDDISSDKTQNVVTFQEASKFFRLSDSAVLTNVGQVVGAWRKGNEKISVSIERWNIAQSIVDAPKFIFMTEVVVSKI